MEPSRYVIFDLDDTLVHSDAVREAFAVVAGAEGHRRGKFSCGHSTRFRDEQGARSSRRSASGAREAVAATDRFLNELDERNRKAPPVP